jgi:hypothetical protein
MSLRIASPLLLMRFAKLQSSTAFTSAADIRVITLSVLSSSDMLIIGDMHMMLNKVLDLGAKAAGDLISRTSSSTPPPRFAGARFFELVRIPNALLVIRVSRDAVIRVGETHGGTDVLAR